MEKLRLEAGLLRLNGLRLNDLGHDPGLKRDESEGRILESRGESRVSFFGVQLYV